ncbi:hypothetical protein AB0M39_27815 [Streptomyces sp. NPDC051907]|uniref:hypothetical protein n=1 Tax=Streptomyces sp. NPDC051907 TaxID=3155284 RepID=UPI00342C2727
MGRLTRAVHGRRPGRALTPPGATAHDGDWTGDLRFAVRCAALLVVLLFTVDAGDQELTWPRAILWTGLGALLFAVLTPPRISAGPGWLASRGLLRRRTVRTDRLVSVRWSDGVAQRLVLRDADGDRVEVDPRVFVANPALWHQLDTDVRGCLDRGALRCGATALRRLGARIERETARTVFKVSGLG